MNPYSKPIPQLCQYLPSFFLFLTLTIVLPFPSWDGSFFPKEFLMQPNQRPLDVILCRSLPTTLTKARDTATANMPTFDTLLYFFITGRPTQDHPYLIGRYQYAVFFYSAPSR
jgi:hypothetical protein